MIFAVALAVRAIELWELEGSALLEFVLGDAKNYVAWGLDIASGNWLGDETFYQAPLYPYFLGSLFSIFGEDLFAVRIFQLFVGAASCALLSLAGWRFFSKSAGIAAGFMLAIYAPAFYADAMIQKSVLDIFLVCMSLWLLSVISTRLDGRACLGLGLALGTMMLSRENALVFPFVLVPWLLLRDGRSRRQRSTMVALFLTGISLVLFPVALRNWVVGGEFHLTTSQFGHNLYIGNNPAADGTYAPLLPGRGDPRIERQDAIDLAESALGRTLTPSEVSGFYTERALRYIREDPIDWLALMSRKVALVFTSIEMVDTEDQYTHAESSVVLQLAGTLFHFGVLAPLAVLGLIITWRRRAILVPLYLLFAAYTATLVVFYVFARYRLPLVPFLALFAGAGVTKGRTYLTESSRAVIARSLLAVFVVAVFCNWPIADKQYMRSVTHYNLANELAGVGRVDEAIGEFRKAVALHAGNALAVHNLGALLAGRGDLTAAESNYRQALEINPKYVQAHFNLARTLLEIGDPDSAIESFGRGLAIEPRHAEVYNELGEIHATRREWASAIKNYETALGLQPGFDRARRNLERARAARSSE
ncbi:MAG: tetratricopeptide repeat protein [Deltaproteobacteria bacterium]|nr:tetratricopeptide repeat protein [Deltaproteobacteria bacterium]